MVDFDLDDDQYTGYHGQVSKMKPANVPQYTDDDDVRIQLATMEERNEWLSTLLAWAVTVLCFSLLFNVILFIAINRPGN